MPMNVQEKQAFKGAGFKVQLKALEDIYGKPALDKVLQACSPETREMATRKVLDNEWVPDRIGSELMMTADRLLGRNDGALIRKIGYRVAKDNLTGIYKIYVKMSSINGLLKRADQIWKQYFSTGTVKVLIAEEKHYQFEVHDHVPFYDTCLAVLGWLDMFMEVYKVKGEATHPECKARGNNRCIFDIKLE